MKTGRHTYRHGVFKSTRGYPLRWRYRIIYMMFVEAFYRRRLWPTDVDIEAVGIFIREAFDEIDKELGYKVWPRL